MLSCADLSFVEVRRLVQFEARAVGAQVSNRRSKALAHAILDRRSRDEWHHNPDNYRNFNHQDPVGEKVIRRVMAQLAGHEPEPI